jgi:hypothetical protein
VMITTRPPPMVTRRLRATARLNLTPRMGSLRVLTRQSRQRTGGRASADGTRRATAPTPTGGAQPA